MASTLPSLLVISVISHQCLGLSIGINQTIVLNRAVTMLTMINLSRLTLPGIRGERSPLGQHRLSFLLILLYFNVGSFFLKYTASDTLILSSDWLSRVDSEELSQWEASPLTSDKTWQGSPHDMEPVKIFVFPMLVGAPGGISGIRHLSTLLIPPYSGQ